MYRILTSAATIVGPRFPRDRRSTPVVPYFFPTEERLAERSLIRGRS
jgi:hypothetical protein